MKLDEKTQVTVVTGRPRTTWHEDLMTTVLAIWIVVALFSDVWSHTHVARRDTFFTPYHIVLYLGVMVMGAWMLLLVNRRRLDAPRSRWVDWIPVGYGIGLIGLGIDGVGAAADFTWHHFLGIETGLSAAWSPTHLLAVTGICAMASSPLRSAWDRLDRWEGTVGKFVPVIVPLALITSIVIDFQGAAFSVFRNPGLPIRASDPRLGLTKTFESLGVARMVMTSLLLLGALLFLFRRWRVPPGTVTILFAAPAIAAGLLTNLNTAGPVALGILAGMVGDGLVMWIRPMPQRPWAVRGAAMLLPLVFSALYLAILVSERRLVWPITIWAGGLLLCALSGLLLSVLVFPPRSPTVSVAGPAR